ncbi:MAG: tyrosine--tRNA ligase [Patescibacteria group bacterium]
MKISEELAWRGFIQQTTLKDLTFLDDKKITFYHGFDASAPSQTVGNLAAMMIDLVFIKHGHKAIILAGGSTSLIGDPGGKDIERPMQSVKDISNNIKNAKKQISKIYGRRKFKLVNNLDWTKKINLLDFLRDTGKFFNVGELIKRDYIATRIGENGSGISFTEFSYTLLQGYDYLHLYDKYGCTLQLGGSDQWANCLSGVDLIRKKRNVETHVMTLPLIINKATGKKFGKSEAGAVWLDETKTSVFDFYQFWLNTDDESSKGYVKIFTEVEKLEYDALVTMADMDPSKRLTQKYLAYAVTALVHGKLHADQAKAQAEKMFSGDFSHIPDNQVFTVPPEYINGNEVKLIEFVTDKKIIESKGKFRELLSSKGLFIDGTPLESTSFTKTKSEHIFQVGKKRFYKLKF